MRRALLRGANALRVAALEGREKTGYSSGDYIQLVVEAQKSKED